MKLEKTDEEYLLMAYNAAKASPDPSTQNGALIVYQLLGREKYVHACNTFPEGVRNTPERLVRPLKYAFIEHSERNVIHKCSALGVFGCAEMENVVMYAPWASCADCARAIIGVGVRKLIVHKTIMDKTPEHWKESINNAFQMFKESGVEVKQVDAKLNGPELRFNGELWRP